MRRLHRADRRHGRALLHDAGEPRRRPRDHDARGARHAEQPDRVQAAFIAEQAAQCGYCTNGMIMTATSAALGDADADDRSGEAGARRQPLPLRHPHAHPARRRARGACEEEASRDGGAAMTVSRRDLLKAGGASS